VRRNPRLLESLGSARGTSLIELLIALVVLSIGILAIGQLFPAGSRSQVGSGLLTKANYYAQQKIEQLGTLSWNDAALSAGRHPSAGYDTLDTSTQLLRFYQVDVLPAPINNLKRVSVSVGWTFLGSRAVTDTAYFRL
jgi:prepilin-type N-terminal cleavage/methylation domain-containing protein